MKIYIPSYGRADNLLTTKYFEQSGLDYTLVLHNEEQKKEYVKCGANPENILVANVPYGMSNIMHFIVDQLEEGEWALKIDDNVKFCTAVEDELYDCDVIDTSDTLKQKQFNKHITANELIKKLEDTQRKAELVNAHYVGFATTNNAYFRSKKYRQVGYVLGKMTLLKKGKINFDSNVLRMDDYGYTAQNLFAYGTVLINNYICPDSKHYQKGGCGTYDERLPYKIKDCNYLMQKYPGLFRYKKKAGKHPLAEVQIRFTNTQQVDEWRTKLQIMRKRS